MNNSWDTIRYYFSLIFKSTKTSNNNNIFFDFIDRELGKDYLKWDKPNHENEHVSNTYELFPIQKKWCGIIHNPYKLDKKTYDGVVGEHYFGNVKEGGRIDTLKLVEAYRQYLKNNHWIRFEKFYHNNIYLFELLNF